jgi:DNA-directed RNA polymerase sigma subunit (sigma70/sigma32)
MSVTDIGNIRMHYPGKEPHELEHSCSLDLADKGDMLLEEIGGVIQVTRERVRQIEGMAFEKIKNDPHFSAVLGEYLEDVA